jgi:site-specific DNA recombinase
LRDAAVARLDAQSAALQRPIDAMYLDKLDGRIDAGTCDRLSAEWRSEQARIVALMDGHRAEGEIYVEEGARLPELAGRCQELCETQPATEPRNLLDFVVSNCSWGDDELTPTFRKPFDLLVATRKLAERTRAEYAPETPVGDEFAIWYPQRDSNPRSPP